jgi:SHAQKYF class myb-like DNA-binding protein
MGEQQISMDGRTADSDSTEDSKQNQTNSDHRTKETCLGGSMHPPQENSRGCLDLGIGREFRDTIESRVPPGDGSGSTSVTHSSFDCATKQFYDVDTKTLDGRSYPSSRMGVESVINPKSESLRTELTVLPPKISPDHSAMAASLVHGVSGTNKDYDQAHVGQKRKDNGSAKPRRPSARGTSQAPAHGGTELIESSASVDAAPLKKQKKNPRSDGGTAPHNRRKQLVVANSTTGRWTPEEHSAFLQGLAVYGREWKRVAAGIPTRTSAQVRSHAQKYFSRLEQQLRDAESNNDENEEGATNPNSKGSRYNAVTSSEITITESVRREAARILAHPESAAAEVNETLERLRERYVYLHERLLERQRRQERDDRMQEDPQQEARADVVDDELVALDVLQGGLMRVSNLDGAGVTEPSGEEDKSEESIDVHEDSHQG